MDPLTRRTAARILLTMLSCLPPLTMRGDDASRVVRIDHFVRVKSTAPAMKSQNAHIYVREVVQAGMVLRGSVPANGVVLFVHGAGTPAEVAFDVPYQDYSWMAFLANAGFDVFSMDMTGYGRSTRPDPMNDPCNLTREQQLALVPGVLSGACEPTYKESPTSPESDWNDLEAVVDHLRKLRRVEQVSLVGWSLGGPRAGGYAAKNPAKVSRLFLLAPAYRTATPARRQPVAAAMNTQSRSDLDANWDRQLGCPDQYDPAARNAVWAEMLAADALGATWGSGVRRAPNVGYTGWDAAVAGKMQIPAAFVAPVHDKQSLPKNVAQLMTDYGSKEKVLIDLGCSSHNALWERNHLLLFQASAEWLLKGSVNGAREGVVKLGY